MKDVNSVLNEIRPGENYAASENFFEDGLLDSLDMTALVAALESSYNVFLDIDEIDLNNLCSVGAISNMLKNKGIQL
jgi:acyl carrier protein